MQVVDGHLIVSASDLVGHLACAHLTVLEYLFGLLLEEDGRPVYREVWAHSLEDEKAAF